MTTHGEPLLSFFSLIHAYIHAYTLWNSVFLFVLVRTYTILMASPEFDCFGLSWLFNICSTDIVRCGLFVCFMYIIPMKHQRMSKCYLVYESLMV